MSTCSSDAENDSAGDSDNDQMVQRGRRNIRQVKTLDELSLVTRRAHLQEEERNERIAAIQKRFNECFTKEETEDKLILDFDYSTKETFITVHPDLVKMLKPHQRDGVRFMWNACFETVESSKMTQGSGCIVAHCMGLGKTFQVITLIHTLLQHPQVLVRTILICCPKNTLLNWVSEFKKWVKPELGEIKVFNLARFDSNASRYSELRKWQQVGGVCIMNYELLRILLESSSKDGPGHHNFEKMLINPGPDLVICDEGHVLKNEETKLSRVMSSMKTLRRVVLTGTPMQNNLKEYYCMVQFVKPNLLGSRTEYLNMFVNPILNGQYHNSEAEDVRLMKERSHILHKTLGGCIQRYDLSTLKKYLKEKQEYVIALRLTPPQEWMYQFYLGNYSRKGNADQKTKGAALFADYQSLQRVWTHPYTLKLHKEKHETLAQKPRKRKRKQRGRKKRALESEEESSSDEYSEEVKIPLGWWTSFVTNDAIEDARSSNKLVLLLQIIRHCEDNGEKLLVFSGSLYSLRMIEHFLRRISQSDFETPELCEMSSPWELEQDYFVMTGATSSEDRARYCKIFNNPHDARARLFLISTKAGGLGINLTAANRAVIFDAQWNPSYDVQSIFRIYRLGQEKTCFVYRFTVSGTMEEKIYERQVTKQSISHRVVDEKQIARHYTLTELRELYQFEPDKLYTEPLQPPRDELMKKLLENHRSAIAGYHEHDSLLEHKHDEELLEVDKTGAWNSYSVIYNPDSLTTEEKATVARMIPENFNPKNFKEVLRKKYSNATEIELSAMMEEIMPRIMQILAKPDFNDAMMREALREKNKKENLLKPNIDASFSAAMGHIDPGRLQPNIAPAMGMADVFRRRRGGGRGRHGRQGRRGAVRQPLNAWGQRGGIEFGTPDSP